MVIAAKDIRIDSTGDAVIITRSGSGKDLDLVLDRDEVVQAIGTRLRTQRGERVVAPEMGLPFETMAGLFHPDYHAATIRAAILQEARVASATIDEITLKRPERQAQVKVTCKLVDGTPVGVREVLAFEAPASR